MKKVKPYNILLSRTDSIGDVVLTLPMAGLLKKNFPECRIFFLGRTYTKPIIDLSIHIDGFINWDELSKLEITDQTLMLKSFKIDTCIHVFPTKNIVRIADYAGIKNRIGTIRRIHSIGRMTHYLYYSRTNSDLHESQLNCMMLKPLGLDTLPTLNEIKDYYGFENTSTLNADLSTLISKDRFNLIIHPKSKGSAAEWGILNFKKLIKLLPSDKFNILVTGTKEEAFQMDDLLQSDKITDLTGKLTLTDLISLITAADGLLAASTGPLHIAAALGKHALGLFSERKPIHPGRWAPIGINAHVFTHKTSNAKTDEELDTAVSLIKPNDILAYLTKLY